MRTMRKRIKVGTVMRTVSKDGYIYENDEEVRGGDYKNMYQHYENDEEVRKTGYNYKNAEEVRKGGYNRRFPEITGKDNLTVFSYCGRVKYPEWRRQLRRTDLRQF